MVRIAKAPSELKNPSCGVSSDGPYRETGVVAARPHPCGGLFVFKMYMKSINIFSIIAGVMLLLALLPVWPYGYFQILRWVVAGVAIHNAFRAYERDKTNWVWGMVIITFVFNPIEPIHLEREIWAIVDVLAAVAMFLSVKKI